MYASHVPRSWSIAGWRSDPQVVRTVRYAFGSTLAMALAMGIDWRLSYLTPVLALTLLGSSAPRPTMRTAIGFVGIVAIASLVGVTLSALLLPYPQVLLIVDGLLLYVLFYAAARGAQPLIVALLLIAVTAIPVVGLQAMPVALAVGEGLVWGAIGAIVTVWLAHVVVPDARETALTGPAPKPEVAKPPPTSSRDAAAFARMNTIVVYPVVVFFFATGSTSVLVLVFVALLSVQPDFSTGLKTGKALIAGNVMGGLAAVAMYEILVVVPEFGYLLLLTFAAGLALGSKLFSEAPTAPLFGMAYSTMLLVVGSTTSMFGDPNTKAVTRVLQITAAVVYLVVMFGVIQRVRREGEAADATG